MLRLCGSTFTPTLTVAIVKEVGDGCRGAAAPGFGGVDGGEDGGHEPLVAVHSEALLAELGVVVGQTEQVTCGIDRRRCTEFEMMDARRGDGICHRFAHAARRRKHTLHRYQVHDIKRYSPDTNQQGRCADRGAYACPGLFLTLLMCVCACVHAYLSHERL